MGGLCVLVDAARIVAISLACSKTVTRRREPADVFGHRDLADLRAHGARCSASGRWRRGFVCAPLPSAHAQGASCRVVMGFAVTTLSRYVAVVEPAASLVPPSSWWTLCTAARRANQVFKGGGRPAWPVHRFSRDAPCFSVPRRVA